MHKDDVDTGKSGISMTIVLQNASCQGGDQRGEQKFISKRGRKRCTAPHAVHFFKFLFSNKIYVETRAHCYYVGPN